MSELTKQIEQNELLAHKYKLLKEIVENELPLIKSHLNDINEILGKINPLVKETLFDGEKRPRGQKKALAEKLFQKMKEDSYTFTFDSLCRDLRMEEMQARSLIRTLKKLHDIESRILENTNGTKEYYYQEGISK